MGCREFVPGFSRMVWPAWKKQGVAWMANEWIGRGNASMQRVNEGTGGKWLSSPA